jgi:hypothetical protein
MMRTISTIISPRVALFILFFSVISILPGCEDAGFSGEKLATAEWTLQNKEKNVGVNSVVENNLLYAYNSTNNKHKLSIKFGAKPTTSAMLKVVDYFKVPLAADEMIIGIQEGDFYYLSTGIDNLSISPTINTTNGIVDNITVRFQNVSVRRHDMSFNPFEATTVSGFISQK